MWISKAEYEELSSTAAENEHDAKMYREIFKLSNKISNKNDIRIYHDFVIVGYDYFMDLFTKQSAEEDEVKNLQAELEWYKVKYHEMKMKAEDRL